jgi:hypothetical protein
MHHAYPVDVATRVSSTKNRSMKKVTVIKSNGSGTWLQMSVLAPPRPAIRDAPVTVLQRVLFFEKKGGLSFISNRQRRKEGTLCASELAGIEPTQPVPEEQALHAFIPCLLVLGIHLTKASSNLTKTNGCRVAVYSSGAGSRPVGPLYIPYVLQVRWPTETWRACARL